MEEIQKVKNFFENKYNNISTSFHNEKYYQAIVEVTKKEIDNEEKKLYIEWLDYFLTMNFSKARFQYLEELIESLFLEKKILLINNDTYYDKIINILCKCAINEVFEKHLEFIENDFFMKTDLLKKDLIKIINSEI